MTARDTANYPQLRPAQDSVDVGVVVSFNTEAAFVERSLLVPESTLSINPLNWTTDTARADKFMNLGAVFPDYSGAATKEIRHFTGARICPDRGTIIPLDVNPDEYPPALEIFSRGVFHVYDYMFFYRNLERDVARRVEAYEKAVK